MLDVFENVHVGICREGCRRMQRKSEANSIGTLASLPRHGVAIARRCYIATNPIALHFVGSPFSSRLSRRPVPSGDARQGS